MGEVRTRCAIEPPLERLPDALAGAVRMDGGDLVVLRSLSKQDAKDLRLAVDEAAWECAVQALLARGAARLPFGVGVDAPGQLGLADVVRVEGNELRCTLPIDAGSEARLRVLPERLWNRAIDRILGQQSLAASYPVSRWGAVLDGLHDGDDDALRSLCELYREPIRRLLQRRLPVTCDASEPEDLLAWVLATGAHRRLRLRENGRGFWFRGYLRRWAMAYARAVASETTGVAALDDVALEAPTTLSAFDRDLASTLIERGLEQLRLDAPRVWRNTMLYGLGFTWEAIGRASGVALTTAYERARRRWEALYAYVRENLVNDLVSSREDAEIEMHALAPALRDALADYVNRHAVDVLARALLSGDAVAVAAAARTVATLPGPTAQSLAAALAETAHAGPIEVRLVVEEALAEIERRASASLRDPQTGC